MIEYVKGDFEDDLKGVVSLCKTWWKDSLFYKLYGVEYNVDKEMFRNLFNYGLLIYTVGKVDDEIVSCFVGVKQAYMFNKELLASSEIVWCVKKEYRSYRALKGLLEAIENLMDEEQIKIWNLNVSNELCYDSVGKFLEKQNYALLDKVYSKTKGV